MAVPLFDPGSPLEPLRADLRAAVDANDLSGDGLGA